MSAFGGAAVGCAALIFIRCYTAYLKARRDECLAFLSLLRELERGMSLYLESPLSVAARLPEPALERSGFNARLKNGASLSEAFDSAADRLLIPSEAKRILTEYFSHVGEGYLDGELRLIARTVSELEPIAAAERQELEKRSKVAGVLTFSAVAGVLILLL